MKNIFSSIKNSESLLPLHPEKTEVYRKCTRIGIIYISLFLIPTYLRDELLRMRSEVISLSLILYPGVYLLKPSLVIELIRGLIFLDHLIHKGYRNHLDADC